MILTTRVLSSKPDLKPRIGMASSGEPYWFKSKLWNFFSQRLRDLTLKLKSQRSGLELQKHLGFEIEPWDYYLHYDSEYFLQFLQNSGYFTPGQQVLIVHFVLRSIETDTIGYFQEEPKQVIQQLIEFAR